MTNSNIEKQHTFTAKPGIGGVLVYQTYDGDVKFEARLDNEKSWMTQKMMVDCFRPQNNI